MNTTYETWMTAVDVEIQKACGLRSDDLPMSPAYHYHDAYDDGETPKQMAKRVIDSFVDF